MNYKDMAVINERKKKKKITKLQDQSYIAFLLATDNFNVSQDIKWYIENKYDMQAIYDDCMFIAEKFLEYNKKNHNTLSQYDSLVNFVIEYENKFYLVHRLVAKAFLKHNLDKYDTIDHLDQNKRNNSLSNLEIVTEEENLRRANENHLTDLSLELNE